MASNQTNDTIHPKLSRVQRVHFAPFGKATEFMNFYKQPLAGIHKFCSLRFTLNFNLSKENIVAFSGEIWYTIIKEMWGEHYGTIF